MGPFTIFRMSAKTRQFCLLQRLVSNINKPSIVRNCCYALCYQEYGEPVKVLKKTKMDLKGSLESNEVKIKMLAAPVNPADINMIQGTYALKPPLPAVGGNEGVGQVVEVGSAVKSLSVGSWVIPADAGWGTWRTHAVCAENQLIKVSNDIPLLGAATMAVNPCTAYRMLTDFVKLKPGDTVIQNGGNSGVGQAVIQISKHMGVKSINIVRNRPNLDELKQHLMQLGATYVVTEEDLRGPVMETIFKEVPKPSLAFNCVGGKNALDMMRHLAKKGTMVTYGGMSRQPVTVPTSALIFKDIRVVGFWMTNWNKENSPQSEERKRMLDFICSMLRENTLKAPPSNQVPFEDYQQAVANAMEGFTSKKQVLVMDPAVSAK